MIKKHRYMLIYEFNKSKEQLTNNDLVFLNINNVLVLYWKKNLNQNIRTRSKCQTELQSMLQWISGSDSC